MFQKKNISKQSLVCCQQNMEFKTTRCRSVITYSFLFILRKIDCIKSIVQEYLLQVTENFFKYIGMYIKSYRH